ncbi:unnamed protein product, partial [Hymenolepis diminuta]
MGVLHDWITSVVGRVVSVLDETCILNILRECEFYSAEGQSSKDVLQAFIEQLFNFSVHEIINMDGLFQDSTECEIAAYLVMLGSMQTQSAKKFIDSALSLSDETQT